jgi:hypothetical protein
LDRLLHDAEVLTINGSSFGPEGLIADLERAFEED